MDLPSDHIPNAVDNSLSYVRKFLPTEEELATSTLWPEIEKIYGHGYEASPPVPPASLLTGVQVVTVATSHDGSLFATACRANNTEHAVVRIVSTTNWDAVGEPLRGHNLTVTRISFSPDDTLILTCSRDRGWRIFAKATDGPGERFQDSCGRCKVSLAEI